MTLSCIATTDLGNQESVHQPMQADVERRISGIGVDTAL